MAKKPSGESSWVAISSRIQCCPEFLKPEEWQAVIEHLGLSRQQCRIAGLLLQGMGDKQIARTLGLSASTVRTHLNRLFARVAASDRLTLAIEIFKAVRAIWSSRTVVENDDIKDDDYLQLPRSS
jgi:DNA-binding NarL/FixJ family response regulator